MAKKYAPPTETLGDHAHTLVRAAISAIPTVGSPAVEVFTAFIGPPLKRRQQEWMAQIADAISDLEQRRHCTAEELARDERNLERRVA